MNQINKFQETKLVVIVREDFKHPGYTLPQSLHSIADFAYEYPDVFKQWKTESNSVVCLAAKSEQNLLKLYEKYSQLSSLGFYNIYIYAGGIFEWLMLQDIYGKPEFPTTKNELDILKFKPRKLLNVKLLEY